MELTTAQFLSGLMAIVIIDLVLAGDNAIVIGLAARKLPKEQQRLAIIWGTLGAILIRAVATLAVVWLLRIPGLLLMGGLLLVWIAYKFVADEKSHEHIKESHNLISAIRTIVIADAVMGIDNVLAVAGAAHGSFLLVVLGLLISVPIIVWGSTLFIRWVERYPSIIYIGAGVLAWTAAKMIVDEPLLQTYLGGRSLLKGFIVAGVIASIVGVGLIKNRERKTII